MKVEFSSESLADIAHIEVQGTLRFGSAAAARYQAKLRNSISPLAKFPNMVRERDDFVRPVRIHAIAAHVIVYETHDNAIRIVRVLAAGQNMADHI